MLLCLVARPSSYREEFADQAYRLCLLGAKDAEVADFFEVTETTINNWKLKHPEFVESLKRGKVLADMQVGERLFERATGYDYTEEQAFKVKLGPHEEKIEIVEVKRHTPPDVTSMIFWLKNRRKTEWRDKQDHEHTGPDGGPQHHRVEWVIKDPAAKD